jgi:hypothetical protein
VKAQPGEALRLTDESSLGNFGETFLKDKYVIFDFEKNRVGLADIEW